jgi:UDP-N-acetylmuramyl pentapeptide phosphotransferase/UDP-N-acetylglucosamine-1-phosphate transferase
MPWADFLIPIAAFFSGWIATRLSIPWLRKQGVLDVPNHRSSHYVPTPRGGGIGILAGFSVGSAIAFMAGLPLPGLEFYAGCGLIALIGLIDDRYGLPVAVRLLIQLVAAALIVGGTGGIDRLPLPVPLDLPLGPAAIPVALIWILGVINVYNFLDGIDGFAALQGVLAGVCLAVFASGSVMAATGLALAGACGGFLVFNWHPAKVFMGDIGSGVLGFTLAALPFQLATSSRGDAIFLVSICLWFFLSDGVFTILRRASRGERVWHAHRSHLYQRLVMTGLRHDRVVLYVLSAAAILAGLAIVSIRSGSMNAKWSVMLLASASFVTYYWWTLRRERNSGLKAPLITVAQTSSEKLYSGVDHRLT